MLRHLLHLSFWSAVLLTILGTIITFVPGSECGWFLFVASLSVAGLFIPKSCYRITAAVLLIFALKAAYDGYQGRHPIPRASGQPQTLKANGLPSSSPRLPSGASATLGSPDSTIPSLIGVAQIKLFGRGRF